MAYLRMNCPNCQREVEYVYVQVGQMHCCKKCNHEFDLEPRRTNYFIYVAYVLGGVLSVGVVGFVMMKFFNWYVYRK